MISFSKIEDIFVAVWCVIMPITGLLVIPSVQGTIPAYLMAFASVAFVILRIRSGTIGGPALGYLKVMLYLFLLWLLLLVGSQVSLIASNRHTFGEIGLIQPEIDPIVLRPTLFTQSIYLTACVFIALYFNFFFQERWMRYVFWGAYLLAGYGIYEWVYYLVFHQSGDFLANRMFGDHPGSWTQPIDFGGVQLVRIKSTLGEPTFFAAVVLPYLYLAMDYRRRLLAGLLLFTALFSTSTACYLCLGFTLFVKSFWTGRPKLGQMGILLVVASFLAAISVLYPDLFRNMFVDKISGNNESGADRLAGKENMNALFGTYTIPNWIFGIGFGYVYSDIYHGLLINTGIIGLCTFLYIFGRPLFLLPVKPGFEGIKGGLLAIMVLSGLSLSELFLPPTYLFLGIAYYKLRQARQIKATRTQSPPRPRLAPLGFAETQPSPGL